MRNTIRNLMLGTALVAGLLGTGVANAAPRDFRGAPARENFRGPERGFEYRYERPVVRGYGGPGFGVVVGAPVVEGYIPPCPGDGYVWLNGAWVFRGGYRAGYRGYGYGPVARVEGGRGYGRGFEGGHERGIARGLDRGGRR